MDLLFGIKPR